MAALISNPTLRCPISREINPNAELATRGVPSQSISLGRPNCLEIRAQKADKTCSRQSGSHGSASGASSRISQGIQQPLVQQLQQQARQKQQSCAVALRKPQPVQNSSSSTSSNSSSLCCSATREGGSFTATRASSGQAQKQQQEGKGAATAGGLVEGERSSYYDFVVIGSGIAGLRFALDVAEHGTVAVVTKSEPQEGSTHYAQGGVSAVLHPDDSVENHIRDTIVAGAYLNDEEVVEVVCREGPDRVRELMAMGASFDRGEDGQLCLAREGGHSHHRIVHAADVTGREIERALLVAAQKNGNIRMFQHHFAVDLVTRMDAGGNTTCYGVDALDVQTGEVVRFLAGSTLLASGGAGHVYPNTTNPTVATGDGVALAQRAHAVISNMEFIQFHPTALADAGLPNPPPSRANSFLITEAVRGAGGILYNQAGERFMLRYDSRAELAPRDVVARSIDDQLKLRGEEYVWLDISHKPKEEILSHFPNIAAECRRCGIDITREPIPVVPAAHYLCGGVQTGLYGETSVRGLWAAGEVACTGLHGANRLASNSLLEALVFAQRAVDPAVEHALEQRERRERRRQKQQQEQASRRQQQPQSGKWEISRGVSEVLGLSFPAEVGFSEMEHLREDEAGEELLHSMQRAVGVAAGDAQAAAAAELTKKFRTRLQAVMWDHVGIVRSTERLQVANRELRQLSREWQAELALIANLPPNAVTVEVCEMRNLFSVAKLIVQSAMQRQESRGLHFVTDFPESCESQRLPTVLVPPALAAARKQQGGLEEEQQHQQRMVDRPMGPSGSLGPARALTAARAAVSEKTSEKSVRPGLRPSGQAKKIQSPQRLVQGTPIA